MAFAVADAVQGHGIGTRLLEQLATVARERSINTFDAYVLGDNHRMLDVFRNSGLAETSSLEGGVCHVTLSLAVTDHFVEHAAARSQLAATASMRAFFEPRVVAVVGANRTARENRIGDSEQPPRRRFHRHGCAGSPLRAPRSEGCPRIGVSLTSRAPSTWR